MADINTLFGAATAPTQEVATNKMETAQAVSGAQDIFSVEAMSKVFDEGNSFNELGDGEYTVKVDKALIKLSKSGNPMLAVTYKVIDGEATNRLVFSNTSFVANGELSARGLAEFGEFIKVLSGATIESAKENALAAIRKFIEGGKTELPLTPFKDKQGKLIIKSYEYNKKDASGNPTDVVVSGTNKTLKALA